MSVAITALFGLALLPYAVFFGIAVYMFIAPFYDKLSGPAFVEFFHRADPHMKVWAPRLSLAQVALTLLLLALLADRWAGPPFGLTAVSLAMGLVSMAIAIWGNVPLNRQMDHWSPAAPPAGWERVRDRWLRYHTLRGAAEAVGFVLLLAAALTHSTLQGKEASRTLTAAEGAAGQPAPRCCEATVYLPLADNDGQPFSETIWQEALEALVGRFGGATLGQPQEGCWLDSRRRVCRERVQPVVISFVPERLGEFRHAIHEVGRRLGQEAMYVRFEEPRVELVSVAAAAPRENR